MNLTLQQLLARTAFREAMGENQTYPQHANCAPSAASASSAPPAASPVPAKRGDCVHRGEVPVRSERCGPCGGKIELKVFACTVHGECTIGKRLAGVAGCCASCNQYVAKDTGS